MTDLAAAVERDIDEILSEAEPAWLDREAEVREEYVYREDDTYEHQKYTFYTKQWEKECERQARDLFPEQFPDKQDEPAFPSHPSVSEMLDFLDSMQRGNDGPAA